MRDIPRNMMAASFLGLLVAAGPAHGAREGTADEAKAMLKRAVAAVLANERAALATFNRGGEGFKQGDLYVFCAGRDGTVDAHADPTQIGRKIQDQYDKVGVAFGIEIMALAKEGQFVEVAYMWPRPGSLKPIHKVTFVTRVADQVCGVGFYQDE